PAAKVDGVAVAHTGVLDGRGQSCLVELRVSPRAGEATHVDERPRARLLEHLEKLVDRPRAMPHGEDAHARRMPLWRTTSSTTPTSSGRSGRATRGRSRGT